MRSKRQGEDFRSLLTRAAADGVSRTRAIDPSNADEAVVFVLRQISATMLDRVLTFSFDDAATLVCDVSGRRLTGVRSPLPEGSGAAGDDAPGAALPTWVNAFVDHLRALCERAQRVSVASAPLESSGQVLKGVSADNLAKALGVVLHTGAVPETNDLFARFLNAAEPDIICAEQVSGEAVTPIFGADDDLQCLSERIEGLLPDVVDREGRLSRMLGQRGLLVLGSHRGAQPDLVIGAFDGVFLVALARIQASRTLPGIWYALQPQ